MSQINSGKKIVFYVILLSFSNSASDLIIKLLASVPPLQIISIRYLICSIVLFFVVLPMLNISGFFIERTTSVLICLTCVSTMIAAICWTISLMYLPLICAPFFSLLVPIFALGIAASMMEKNLHTNWLYCICSLIGAFFIAYDMLLDTKLILDFKFNIFYIFILLASSFFFAISDVLNKKILNSINTELLMFILSASLTIVSYIISFKNWIFLDIKEVLLLILLGLINIIIFSAILNILNIASFSQSSPYRYTEILFSGIFSSVFFNYSPNLFFYIGSLLIVIGTYKVSQHLEMDK